MKVLFIDNFDSFTYNLVDEFEKRGCQVIVYRNNIRLNDVEKNKPGLIVISPGPATPKEAGICKALIKKYYKKIPIFGVCLGHQCIIEALGGKIVRAPEIVHGKPSKITHCGKDIFQGLENPLHAGRYHSLVGTKIPECLNITATVNNIVMAVKHKKYPLYGVQFHPESIMTPTGGKLIENLLNEVQKKMIKEAISKLIKKKNLGFNEAEQVMGEIMSGQATEAQIASFLTALRIKGETIDEITAFAKVMREKASTINPKVKNLVDTCGTGGDCSNTFNISTTAAFVVAGCGIAVAKHGNKSVSSKCGSADILTALGVNIELTPQEVEECIEEVGIGFMFAPIFHGAMKYAINPRREIGIRTVFNILGPLTNPANAKSQLIGVFDPNLTEPLATVLGKLGLNHAFVVHGSCLDEIATHSETRVSEYKERRVRTYKIKPTDFGMKMASLKDIEGGTPEHNAKITMDILKGKKGPKRDITVLNAAAAIIAAGKSNNFRSAIKLAEKSIDSGKALEKLNKLKEFSNR